MSLDGIDMAEAFGASIDVTRPGGDEEAFFLVKRKPEVDHDGFFEWLVQVIGGTDNVLFHHRDGLFVIWTTFEVSRYLKSQPNVHTVGGVMVDRERLQGMLGGQ